MTDDSRQWLIRCIVVGGATKPFLSRLAHEAGVWNFFYNGSRSAVADHTRTRARVVQFIENEEIFIVVDDARLRAVMQFCYTELDLGSPGRGVIYVTPVDRSTAIVLPPMDDDIATK